MGLRKDNTKLKSMTNIPQGKIQKISIPFASSNTQNRIPQKIEALFAQANIIEQAMSLHRAEEMDQSILAQVFRGELW